VYGICGECVRSGRASGGNNTHLTRPERDERAEGEAGLNLAGGHSGERGAEAGGEHADGARLDLDLGHLERAERDVREDLRAGGAREPDRAAVLGRVLLAGEVRVLVLEDLVEPVLEHALERVADERRAEALEDAGAALLGEEGADTRDEALVLGRVDLHVALGDVDGRHAGVRDTARERTAEHALGVVRRVVRDRASEPMVVSVSTSHSRTNKTMQHTAHPTCRQVRGGPW
jgi:hypothetical protein